MYRKLRRLRRVSQVVFLGGFVVLFGLAAYPLRSPVPVDLYLRADPLIALSAMVSLRRMIFPLLWYAIPVVVLSIFLGRVFCGWICPMGTAIDASERVVHLRARGNRSGSKWRVVKYGVLVALLVTMLLPAARRPTGTGLGRSVGLSAVYWADPIALATRTLTWVALPVTEWGLTGARDTAADWVYSDYAMEHPWVDRALSPVHTGLSMVARPAYFRLGLAAFLMFVAIVALGRYESRFWCRNLCPLGALLGWLSRLSPVRLAVGEKCNQCRRCVNECKTGAISEDPKRYSGPECLQCMSCLAICPQNAIELTTGYDGSAREDPVRLDRRRVLTAVGAGAAAVVLTKVSLGSKRSQAGERILKISSERLIRPPGALAEDEFVTACVRCGECMKACPTNALQPAVGEGGLEALGTPVIVARGGPCSQPCNLCGQVCPTRAIEPFTVEEKSYLYVGTAVVDRSTCIAWAQDKECLVCDEACSYNAIEQRPIDGLGRPVVDERVCVGCGMCEYVCPVEPMGAIRVISAGDRRHLGREGQRAVREQVEQDSEDVSPYPGL